MSGKSLKIGIAAIAILLMTVAAVGAVSAATLTVTAPSQVNVGQTFNVTVSISSTSNVNAVSFQLNYNPSVVQPIANYTPNGGYVKSGSGNLQFVLLGTPTSSDLLVVTFKAVSAGTSQFTLSDAEVNGVSVSTTNAITNAVTSPTPTPTPTPVSANIPPADNIVITNNNLQTYDFSVHFLTTPIAYYSSTNVPTLTGKTVQVVRYEYGTSFELGVTNKLDNDGGLTVKLKNLATGKTITVGSMDKGVPYKVFKVSGLSAGYYSVYIVGPDNKNWDTATYTSAGIPYVVLVYNAFPTISITLNNPRTPIAKGDDAYFTIHVTGLAGPTTVYANVTGPFANKLVYTKTLGWKYGTIWYLHVPTNNSNSGEWKITVHALDSKKSMTFKVEGVSVTANLPSVVYLGQSIKIEGTSNLAETGSVYDNGTLNHVNVTIYNPSGVVVYKATNVHIKSDGTWECVNDWTPALASTTATGSYKVVVHAVATKTEDDTETYYVLVKEPTISINLAPSYVRGEGLHVQGTSNLGANVALVIHITGGNLNDYPLLINDTSNPFSVPASGVWVPGASVPYENIYVYTSADGSWQTEKLYINPHAARTTYTVKVYVANRPSVIAVGTINVVKATLTAKLSMSTVTLGSQVTLKGTSPVEDIFLFTSDKNVFENVGEMPPSDKAANVATLPAQYKPMHIKTIAGGNTFEVTLKVSKNASYGTYTLYVVASPNGTSFDLSKDAYIQLPVTIEPVGIIYAPDTFTITQGSAKKLFVEVNAKPNDVVYACYTLEGHGVDIKKGATPSTTSVTFANNNQLVKWNETANGTYWMFATIYPYYDTIRKVLVSDYTNMNTEKLLPVGTYTLTIHLYTKDPDSGMFEETASKEITMDVQPVIMTVTCPSEVVKGEPIKLVIHENRVNCNQKGRCKQIHLPERTVQYSIKSRTWSN